MKCLKQFIIIFFINLACFQSYGENCRYPCSLQCYNNTCDRINGRCLLGCKNRFYGELCERGNIFFWYHIKFSDTVTVTETFYFPKWTVSDRWAKAELTVSERTKTLNGICDWWAHTEHKLSAKGSTRWTVNER